MSVATRRVQFGAGECYHVYNRGVEKRDVFLTQGDYERFLYALFVCNDRRPITNTFHGYRGLTSIRWEMRERRDSLVDILCFCLMPNHFHLLIRQRHDDAGVPLFMQKVGTAYTMYFNAKYERAGGLFQGTYKVKRVAQDEYLLPLSRYIHLNPLDLAAPEWRESGLPGHSIAHKHLLLYPWSSYPEYVGFPRYPFLVDASIVRTFFPMGQNYAAYVSGWTRQEFARVSGLALEHESEYRGLTSIKGR